VKFELYYGAYKGSRTAENLQNLSDFFADLFSLSFDGKAAQICGQLRAKLQASGTPIGAYDLQIAAIALANNLILITHNTREFTRIEGLRLEDWESVIKLDQINLENTGILTADDRLFRKAKQYPEVVAISVENPVVW
jgi:tRNA(fMet)-specific endonuclease VapC